MNELSEREFQKLKQEVEAAKSRADQARGAHDQLMKRLEEEFDCHSLAEAKKLLTQLQTEATEAADAFEKAFKSYQQKYESD